MLKYLNYLKPLGYGALGSASTMSSNLASIILNMDIFTVTSAYLRTIYNDGQNGSTSDAPMYASNHIYLDGSTQSVDYPIPNTGGTGSFLTYYDIATKSHVTFGNSVDGGSSDNLEEVTNGTFNTDVSGWTAFSDAIVTWDTGRMKIYADGDTWGVSYQYVTTVIGKTYFCSLDAIEGDSTAYLYKASSASIADGDLYDSGETIDFGTKSFSFIATSTSTSIAIMTKEINTYTLFDNISLKEILPISTTYTQTNSHSNLFTTTVVPHVNDLAYLDAQPESVARLVDGETVAGLTFDLADIEAFYPGNEGVGSGAYVQDVMVDLGAEEISNRWV